MESKKSEKPKKVKRAKKPKSCEKIKLKAEQDILKSSYHEQSFIELSSQEFISIPEKVILTKK